MILLLPSLGADCLIGDISLSIGVTYDGYLWRVRGPWQEGVSAILVSSLEALSCWPQSLVTPLCLIPNSARDYT